MKIKKHIQPRGIFRGAFLCFYFLGGMFYSFSQNKGETVFSAIGISKVVVNGNQIFNIDIETSEAEDIKVFSLTDGEYQDDFKVFSELKDGLLNIGLIRSPFYNKPDDKRNAHKVIAATLKIILPKNHDLSVTSDVGSVDIKGDFNTLFIQLAEGYFKFEGIARSAVVNTIEGAISIATQNADVEAISSYGKIDIEKMIVRDNRWQLQSIHGNINVVKKE